MRNCCAIALVSVILFLNSCARFSAYDVDNEEQVDLYLNTLDDKHFVWCNLDLDQCREDFENWKATSRGQAIIKEYEKEKAGLTYKTRHASNMFRTQFMADGLFIERDGNDWLEDEQKSPERFGPELPSKY